MSYEKLCEQHGLWVDTSGGGCTHWVYGSLGQSYTGFTLWVERLHSHKLDDEDRALGCGVDIVLEDNAADRWQICWAAHSEAEFETLLTNAIKACDALNRLRNNHG